MSEIKIAKLVRMACFVVFGITALGVIWLVGWLLTLWAVHHFLSFAWVVGIAVSIGLIAGVYHAWEWQDRVIRRATHQDKLDEYANKYNGAKPRYDYNRNIWRFDLTPAGWDGTPNTIDEEDGW